MIKGSRGTLATIALILVLIIFVYVWPGVWRYTYYERGFLRLDKLTGNLYRRQTRQYNAVWATLEKDLQEQRKKDPTLRPMTAEETAKIKPSDRLKEVTAAIEKHSRSYHEWHSMTLLDRLEERARTVDSFSPPCKEAIEFAFQRGYSIEEICSVRPAWCSTGVQNMYNPYMTTWVPGKCPVDEYERSMRHDWVPIKRQ